MAIRPVDLQLLVHKTTEANRMEQGEGRRPEFAHQQFSQIIEKKTEEEMHQVMQSMKAEQEAVDKDGSNKNKQEKNKKNKRGANEKADRPKQRSGGSMFDISV